MEVRAGRCPGGRRKQKQTFYPCEIVKLIRFILKQTPFHLAFCPIPLSPCFFYSAPGSRIRAPLGVQLDANPAAPKPHIEDNDKSPLLLYLGIRSLLVPFMFLVIAE